MKITNAYLQNQILPRTERVRPKDRVPETKFEVPENPSVRNRPEQSGEVTFELSRESRRILSMREKETIAELFDNGQAGKTYTPRGQVAKMDVLIGRKIDVKG